MNQIIHKLIDYHIPYEIMKRSLNGACDDQQYDIGNPGFGQTGIIMWQG